MLTRKTTTGYRVAVANEDFQESFDFYSDALVCFKNISREYDLKKVCRDFSLEDWEIDYLLGEVSKQKAMEDDIWRTEEDFIRLDEMKKNYQIIWLSFGEHSQIYIGYGDDGVMLIEKWVDAKSYFDELNAWMNWRIYRIDVYEPQKFTSEDTDTELTYWEYVDWGTGYFDIEEALNSLPDYAGEIIKDSESERFEEFERC